MPKIILASKSPRRQELFKILDLEFEMEESDYEEDLEKALKPKELAIFLSQGKAKAVASQHKNENAVIIAADTLIAFQDKILGKPSSKEEALKILWTMRGKCHSVITGLTIINTQTGKTESKAVETRVYFRKFSKEEVKNYVATGEPQDKAGAYGIQGLGQLLIEKIEGDYSNVVGLPLGTLARSLKKFGLKVI